MIIKDEAIKSKFFDILKYEVKIPTCVLCGKLFDLGFPSNETGLLDNLICQANGLICTCENNDKVIELHSKKKDDLVDIGKWFKSI